MYSLLLLGALVVMLVGCGQTGTLYLPKQHSLASTSQKESTSYEANQKEVVPLHEIKPL